MARCEAPERPVAPLAAEDIARSGPSAVGEPLGEARPTAPRGPRLLVSKLPRREHLPRSAPLGRRPRSSWVPCDRSQGTGRSAGGGMASAQLAPSHTHTAPLRAGTRSPTQVREGGHGRNGGAGLASLCPSCAPEACSLPRRVRQTLCPRHSFYWMRALQPPPQSACVLAGGRPALGHERATLQAGPLGPSH